MAQLLVRNIDDEVVKKLKERAAAKGVSAEAEHRAILREALGVKEDFFGYPDFWSWSEAFLAKQKVDPSWSSVEAIRELRDNPRQRIDED